MSQFPNFCAPKSKRQLPNSRINLAFGSMIPNPRFLCALNPICSRFLKKHAPEIPIDPNFQAVCSQNSSERANQGQRDCNCKGAKLAVWSFTVVGSVKEPRYRQDNNESKSQISESLKGRLIESRLAGYNGLN